MMKLSRRIRDLVRAGLGSPGRYARLGKTRSPARLEAQLEQIRKSLIQAAAREDQVRDDLAEAEREGRERDAVRLRRELADLARSTDELQKALDLIEARIEIDHAPASETEAPSPPGPPPVEETATEEAESPVASTKDAGDLPARKARLAAPEKK